MNYAGGGWTVPCLAAISKCCAAYGTFLPAPRGMQRGTMSLQAPFCSLMLLIKIAPALWRNLFPTFPRVNTLKVQLLYVLFFFFSFVSSNLHSYTWIQNIILPTLPVWIRYEYFKEFKSIFFHPVGFRRASSRTKRLNADLIRVVWIAISLKRKKREALSILIFPFWKVIVLS